MGRMPMATTKTQLRIRKNALFADLGYEPHDGQRLVHESNAPRRVLACGVRWGKSLCAAMEGLAAAMAPKERSFGWIVAPTYDLGEKVFREIVRVAGSRLRHYLLDLSGHERTLALTNLAGGRSEIRVRSAENPVSLLGEGLDWLIVDEAAQLKPAIWQSYLSERLHDRKGWALFLSTPRGKGWYYDLFRRGQDGDSTYASWNAPSWQNPYLDSAAIEAERGTIPEAVFRQEYEGEFLEGAGQVFRNVRDLAIEPWREPVAGERYLAGLDLAKVQDFTVLVLLDRERRVVFADRFQRLDWALQIQRVRATIERYGNVRLLVDSTGAGEPVYEALLREGIPAEPYAFTVRSKDALVNNLALLLERRAITRPRPDLWPEGIDELEAFGYSISPSGGVSTGAPPGVHDDCVMALALAVWHAQAGSISFLGISEEAPPGHPVPEFSGYRVGRGRAEEEDEDTED